MDGQRVVFLSAMSWKEESQPRMKITNINRIQIKGKICTLWALSFAL
jgi:hypothetical protein